jgi:DNA-binding phage protein
MRAFHLSGILICTMGVQDFFLRQMMKSKLKDVPEGQREQIMALVTKDPELFKKIGEEVDRRVKKGGEPQMKATMEVMKKYRAELQQLMQS